MRESLSKTLKIKTLLLRARITLETKIKTKVVCERFVGLLSKTLDIKDKNKRVRSLSKTREIKENVTKGESVSKNSGNKEQN
jgi:hypothetical protein